MVYFSVNIVYNAIKGTELSLECKVFGRQKDFHILNLEVVVIFKNYL